MSTTKHEALIISSLIIFKAKLADFGIQEIISILAVSVSCGSQFLSGAAVKTSREENSNIARKFLPFCKKQDVQRIKDDETMKDKDVSQINMYDLSLGLVSKESGK